MKVVGGREGGGWGGSGGGGGVGEEEGKTKETMHEKLMIMVKVVRFCCPGLCRRGTETEGDRGRQR
jgi:hypothetical protein